MPDSINVLAETAFEQLISDGDVELMPEDGELHIAADHWTLVLEGDPLAGIMIALDDESGSPETTLREAIDEDSLAAMRDLDSQLQGKITSLLGESADPLAKALAEILAS